jgi:hypothetical protein
VSKPAWAVLFLNWEKLFKSLIYFLGIQEELFVVFPNVIEAVGQVAFEAFIAKLALLASLPPILTSKAYSWNSMRAP